MNDSISGSISTREDATDWARVRAMSDEEVHAAAAGNAEVPATDAAFWAGPRVVMPRRKEMVTIRLDADLLEWLRRAPGYHTRINAVLRAFMAAERRGEV